MSTIFQQSFEGLDNTIKAVNTATTGNPTPAYTADNGTIKADFYTSGNQVIFTTPSGYTFAWTPQNMKYVDATGMSDLIYTVQDVPIEVKSNYARYNRPMESVDDWFIVEGNQLKHQILVQGFQRDPVPFLTAPIDFVFGGQVSYDTSLSIWIDGLPGALTGAFETTGSIYFKDADGNLVYSLPQIVAYDSKIPERASTTGKYNVTQNSAGVLAFDIVVDNAWFADTARVYPIVIDPTVVSSATAAYGLSMGRSFVGRVFGTNTLYALVQNRAQGSFWGYNLYQSTDNGNTWGLLSAVADADSSTTASMTGGTLMVTKTGEVYIYAKSGAGNETLYYYPGTGSTLTSNKLTGGGGTTPVACTDSNGNVWFASSNNSTTGYLILVPKGNVAGAVRVSGTIAAALTDMFHAYFDSTVGGLLVVAQNVSGTQVYKIVPNSLTAPTSFTATQVISVGSTQTDVAICRLPNGNVLVAYIASSSTTLTVAEYTTGGTLVNTKTQTATATGGVSVAANTNYIAAVSDGTNYYIFALVNTTGSAGHLDYSKNGGAWTTVSSGTVTNSSMNLFNEYAVSGYNNLDFIYQTGLSSPYALQYGVVALNQPPNAPTLNTEPNFDATTPQTLNWTFSDPNAGDTQSAYQLQILDAAANTTVVDSGKVNSTAGTYSLAANTLTNGKQYQWRVMTWDQAGASSPWSSYSTFYTATTPTVSITSPTASQVLNTSSLTAVWNYADAGGNAQQSYDLQLYDSTGTTLLWDSGTVTSTSNTQTIGYTLANNTTYQVKVLVTNAKGISSTKASQTFSTSFTAPAQATLAVTAKTGYYQVAITNPTPTGGQPTVTSHDLYRRRTGATSWTRIATGLAAGATYNDYNVSAGVQHDYYVQSNASGNQTSSNSATVTGAALQFYGYMLHQVVNPAGTILNVQYQQDFKKDQWTPSSTTMEFAGRPRPVVEFGETDSYTLTGQKLTFLSWSDWQTFLTLAQSKQVLCLRDGRGRKNFVVVTDIPNQDDAFGFVADVTFVEVAYTEAV